MDDRLVTVGATMAAQDAAIELLSHLVYAHHDQKINDPDRILETTKEIALAAIEAVWALNYANGRNIL